jgi:uncharacterized membrane protein
MAVLAKSILSHADREAVQSAIAEAESRTAGEVRVSIRERRSRKEQHESVEQLAHHEFHALGMHKTVDRTGVLIYLLLSDRKLRIVADEGIHKHVDEKVWQEIADRITAHFRGGSYRDGLIDGVRAVGEVLATFVPPKPGDRNELPNDVVTR